MKHPERNVIQHPSAPAEHLVGPQVVADWLGVSKRTVQDMAARREIPHKRIGKQLRFWMPEVLSWALEDQDQPVEARRR